MIYAWLICILLFLLAITCSFYWDWAGTYVGVGMMCPYSTTISVLIGAIFGYTFMFPELEKKSGKWYTNEVSRDSFHGYTAYKVMSCSIHTTIYIYIYNCTAYGMQASFLLIYLLISRLIHFVRVCVCVCVDLHYFIDDSWG